MADPSEVTNLPALEGSDGDPPGVLTHEEADDLVDAESTVDTIAYTGQDFDVDGLIRRLDSNDIVVPTFGHNDPGISAAGFQRAFVWTRPQMDRFVESILLGYPIPGIFLVRQADRRYLVLDGQQRLKTLQAFHTGIFDSKEFALANVADAFKGLTYKSLPEGPRRLFDDTFIHATIVSTDGSADSLEAIYRIFERLNSGGTQLTPHEIRVALFAGPFIDFLESLNADRAWRALYGKRSPRLRDQELVLRILALYANAATYRRPLKTFLNAYVSQNRNLAHLATDTLSARFALACQLIMDGEGPSALRLQSQVNAALTEALFVGTLRRLDHGSDPTSQSIMKATKEIREDPRMIAAVSRATADEENVRLRLEIATARLSEA